MKKNLVIKILYVLFITLFSNNSNVMATTLADNRIMGKNTKPHIIFQCHDINDPKAYLLGFTPVSHNNEPYYVVSYFRMQNGNYLPDAGESLMFVLDEFHGGKNVWFNIVKHENYIGLYYNYLGEGLNLHRSLQEWLTQGFIMIRPIKNNQIPESAKLSLNEKKVNEIISNLKTLDAKIKKLKEAYNDDPVNHLNNIFIENANLYNYFTKIYEIGQLGIKDLVVGDHFTNKELCKKN